MQYGSNAIGYEMSDCMRERIVRESTFIGVSVSNRRADVVSIDLQARYLSFSRETVTNEQQSAFGAYHRRKARNAVPCSNERLETELSCVLSFID